MRDEERIHTKLSDITYVIYSPPILSREKKINAHVLKINSRIFTQLHNNIFW